MVSLAPTTTLKSKAKLPKRHRIERIILIISFVPIIYLLIISINAAINGTTSAFLCVFNCPKIYGWEAFWNSFSVIGTVFIYIPILPLVLIYQIYYLIYYVIKKHP